MQPADAAASQAPVTASSELPALTSIVPTAVTSSAPRGFSASAGGPSAFTRIGSSSQPNLFAGHMVRTGTALARLVAALPEASRMPRERVNEMALDVLAEVHEEVCLSLCCRSAVEPTNLFDPNFHRTSGLRTHFIRV